MPTRAIVSEQVNQLAAQRSRDIGGIPGEGLLPTQQFAGARLCRLHHRALVVRRINLHRGAQVIQRDHRQVGPVGGAFAGNQAEVNKLVRVLLNQPGNCDRISPSSGVKTGKSLLTTAPLRSGGISSEAPWRASICEMMN
jgi:hypothetical protein